MYDSNDPSCLAVLTQERLLRIFKKAPHVGDVILVKKQEDRELEEYAAMIRAVKKAVDQAAHNSRAFTVPEFFQVRNKLKCAQMLNSKLNFLNEM